MSKKLSKEDRDLIAAERIGDALCKIPAVDRFMSNLIQDKGAKNALTGLIALKGIEKIAGAIATETIIALGKKRG